MRDAAGINRSWVSSSRWKGISRPYSAEDVVRLRGSIHVEHSIALHTAEKLWESLNTRDYVHSLGALTGNQALQQARAGLPAIYMSGWQVAADANNAGHMYPDQSLYPADSVPNLVRAINNTLRRADQISHSEGDSSIDYLVPIVADAEAGFGGVLNAFELMTAMIEGGAAGVHFEDQLSSAKKCGHMGGKVLIPTQEAVQKLIAARLAADIADTPTLVFARTDALAAKLVTCDIDRRDQKFLTGERTTEGFYRSVGGMDQAISRGLAYAPFADLIWMETATPTLAQAEEFADAIHSKFPGKMLAYNCSPSFNWKANLSDEKIRSFREDIAKMGYKFQFITLAGFHSLNYAMFDLATKYGATGMTGYVELQEEEFAAEDRGYTAVKHQHEVGASWFDAVSQTIMSGQSSITAMDGSTEEAQFDDKESA